MIYGLPCQTTKTIEQTILRSISLQPDRIAFYSYAHVPWVSKAQRLFDENDLPDAIFKMQLYQLGWQLFTEHGYNDIGMDRFALPKDDLYKAWKQGWLHRNFMGYTAQRTNMLLGFGVSSISDAGVCFAQNEKILHNYYKSISNNEFAVTKGYFLNEEDTAFRKYILDISCKAQTKFNKEDLPVLKAFCFSELVKLEKDNLIIGDEEGVYVTQLGRQFIRNICKAFHLHLLRNEQTGERKLFNKAV